MKRTSMGFLGALLVLGTAVAQLPSTSAPGQGSTNSPDTTPMEKSAATVETNLLAAIKAVYPDATMGGFQKQKAVGTNDLYSVDFTANKEKMRAEVVDDGTLVETEQPGDIAQFPEAARTALIKAMTDVGMRETGIKINIRYAEIRPDGSGGANVVRLPAPVMIYGAKVQNHRGQTGKVGFSADGTPVERPSWGRPSPGIR
jgi:hypothetical protein